ncbi:hypothetical protein L6164_002792 [Bauhinia variegata]|uniref:Uncharacterized protein n=1 Tax=Bauhinia variegata TaxID=167791 RepID=A0ACB9Q198_BAUVA|nr:hypothetical protein L6164_002792 [Bauhinia variegata]
MFHNATATNPNSPFSNEEGNALRKSQWWNTSDSLFNSSNHCLWSGIKCNEAGSITAIYAPTNPVSRRNEFGDINLTAFPNLELLDLSGMGLKGSIPAEIATLPRLKFLTLFNNLLSGEILSTFSNFTQLEELDLSRNHFSGVIPSQTGNLTNLLRLDLSYNYLRGPLFLGIESLKNLVWLDLSWNILAGPVPPKLGSLKNLNDIYLGNNIITGQIPSSLGQLKHLEALDLGGNRLDGPIPLSLYELTNLTIISLDSNQISGYIHPNIGKLSNLKSHDFSHNNLDGSIPYQVGKLRELVNCDISHNRISGEIPLEFGYLCTHNQLDDLDLSYNNIVGNIPRGLATLSHLDLSYNSLSACLPEELYSSISTYSFYGNKGLKTSRENASCSKHYVHPSTSKYNIPKGGKYYIDIVLPITSFFIILFVGALLVYRFAHKKVRLEKIVARNGDLFSIWNYDGKIAFEDIIQATEDFDVKYCIGTGGYGSVYRAKLPMGRIVALKKLHRMESQNPRFAQSFQNEIKMLTKVRHRNMVKLYGFCLHNRCMFLIYEYIERGSLFCALNNDVEAQQLNWGKRVNIIKGIAHALAYMHHDCSPAIIHRDITSNNILLNSETEAIVSDFGTARFLDPNSSNQTLSLGTYGYIAPVWSGSIRIHNGKASRRDNLYVVKA